MTMNMKVSMMKTRRKFIAAVATGMLTLVVNTAIAAQPTVEIVAMPHPPVQSALKPLRDWLSSQGGKLRVIEIDAESSQGERRLDSVGLKGHIPITILIDGRYRYQRKNGSMVSFVNFPAVKDSPPGIRGDWVTADVQAVLSSRVK